MNSNKAITAEEFAALTAEEIIPQPYNPAWKKMYQQERHLIGSTLDPLVYMLEHIGSTAVPGIIAKPTIDMMLSISRLEDAQTYIGRLEPIGYRYIQQFEQYRPHMRFLLKRADRVQRTHHMQLVEQGSEAWKTHIEFRNKLRNNNTVARNYEALKIHCARIHPNDRIAYVEAKTHFINQCLTPPQS